MRGNRTNHPYKYGDYDDYRIWLLEAGYSPRTISKYLRSIYIFQKDGFDLTDENIGIWQDKLTEDGVAKKSIAEFIAGLKKYRQFINGEPCFNKYTKFRCDEDCFRCKYPDCLMPDYLIVTKGS